ncbi:unnamed protein product, partial [Meganyctiphanes norvegica]
MAHSNRSSMAVAETLAHEIGHNIGMEHDEEVLEGCSCSTGKCLMGAKGDEDDSNPRFLDWSDCSKKHLDKWLNKNFRNCLNNVPTAVIDIPQCGNGVVEIGEECDCGHAKECDTICCDTKTCRLTANATCAAGACCDLETCTPHPRGWKCREAREACDLPEFCRGGSNTRCPDDVTKMEGEPCPQGSCYHGRCGTYNLDEMCRALWGPTSNTVGKDSCR